MTWCAAALLLGVLASPTPAATLGRLEAVPAIERLGLGGHFHDAVGLLPTPAAQEFERDLARLESQTGHRVHLLILPTMEGGFRGLGATLRLADQRWRIGRDRDHAGVLLLHVQESDILHVDTLLGREIPAVESGIGALLETVARFKKAGDDEGAFRVAVQGLASLVDGRDPPPAPAPRPRTPAVSAESTGSPDLDSAAQGREPGGGTGSVAIPDGSQASGYVIDEADILSPELITSLNGFLHEHERQTSNQIVVLTTPSLGGETLEGLGLRRATALRIGQKDKDNGVLLLVVRDDREVRIEVGYGLEGALPDALCGRIIREVIVPRFREGDYDGGVLGGAQRLVAAIRGEYKASVVDRARGLVGWLPTLPSLPLTPQFILGFFFWFFAIAACLTGPELVSIAGKPAHLGILPTLPVAAYLLASYPGLFLAPLALGAIALLTKVESVLRPAGTSGRGEGGQSGSWSHSSSRSGSSSSGSSSSSSSSSGSSFEGGGGSFGGGGASGRW